MFQRMTAGSRRRLWFSAGIVIACAAMVISSGQPRADSPDEAPSIPLSEQGAAPETSVSSVEQPLDLLYYPNFEPDVLPPFPPLDEIPPMPMPEGRDSHMPGNPQHGYPVTHDALTGETTHHDDFQMSPSPNRDEEGPFSGGGYRGADGGEDASVEPSPAFSNMIDINTTGDFPYRMNCKLVQRFENANGDDVYFVCSASMYDAETVLTAGHCIYHQTHGWAKEVWVIPGWDGNGNVLPIDSTLQTYGWARGTWFASWSTWTNDGNYDGDVGLIRVERAVGMLTGWYGWVWGFDCAHHQSQTYNNLSYPAEGCGTPGLHNGRDMYYWWGTVDSCPNNQLQIDTTGGCFNAGWGGMSGSSTYYIDGSNRLIHAVASTADRATWIRYCRQWESWIDYYNNTFVPDARGTTFDIQALDTNAEPSSIAAGAATTTLNHLATNPTNGTGSGTYTMRVYLSDNDNISEGDTLLSTQTLNWTFGTMSSVRVNMGNVTIPANTPPGNYWLGIVYDSATDTNSGNNDTDGWDAVPITVFCPSVAAPTGVTATDGSECDFVRINWNSVAGASEYRVFRSGALIANWQAGTSYDDFGATPGVTYTYTVRARNECFQESASSAGDTGFRCERPANDDCFNAQIVFNGSWSISNLNATTDGPIEPSCQFCCGEENVGSDVWYVYTPLFNGRANISLCGSSYDTKIAVYEGGCPGSGSLVGCNDDSSCGLQSEIEFFCEGGLQYYIRVGGYNGAQGTGTMNISYDRNRVDECLGVDNLAALSINSSTGVGNDRIVSAAYNTNIDFSIVKPPAGGNGKFVVHMNPGMPTSSSISPLPAQLGDTCFNFLISSGATPVGIWNNIGKTNQLGESNVFGTPVSDPLRAPTTFYSTGGVAVFPIFTSWTIQGAILNPTATSPKGASVTNPVILDVLP